MINSNFDEKLSDKKQGQLNGLGDLKQT